MELKASYKAAKLIRVSMRVEEGKIKSIRITGDFFMYPEEAIRKLESILKDCPLIESEILNRIEMFYKSEKVTTPMIEPRDFLKAIMRAFEGGQID